MLTVTHGVSKACKVQQTGAATALWDGRRRCLEWQLSRHATQRAAVQNPMQGGAPLRNATVRGSIQHNAELLRHAIALAILCHVVQCKCDAIPRYAVTCAGTLAAGTTALHEAVEYVWGCNGAHMPH